GNKYPMKFLSFTSSGLTLQPHSADFLSVHNHRKDAVGGALEWSLTNFPSVTVGVMPFATPTLMLPGYPRNCPRRKSLLFECVGSSTQQCNLVDRYRY